MLSKSSVHRLQQAMDRRNGHPESWFWETEEGRSWLTRLVVATLYIFGLKRGVGADSINEFCCRLRLASQIGCSPSALRGVIDVVEHAILETTAAWEQEGIAHGETRPIIGAVDETFLARMMLVFMDLVSGYLETVSLLVHPWRLVDSTRHRSADVEYQLHAETQAIEALIATSGLPVNKKALDKVRRQLAGVAALVDVWWQRVWQDGDFCTTPRTGA